MGFTTLYVTFLNKGSAKDVSRRLIDEDLIVCANFHTINSMFKWKGQIKDGNEVVAIMKLPTANHQLVEDEIKRIHMYDCPCIMRMDVTANKEFEDWINNRG